MTSAPVELHVVSDATGETAARLVQALEAQFPEQEFVEIRHPRVESEEDLHLAVQRMRGRPAVVVYTLVAPELRDAMRALCRRAKLHYADLVLVGVSRTSKTPLSIYLGYLGYKAANVPVVKGIDPPAELFRVD